MNPIRPKVFRLKCPKPVPIAPTIGASGNIVAIPKNSRIKIAITNSNSLKIA